MKRRALLRLSLVPALAAAVLSGAVVLLCGPAASNLLPSTVAYALLVLP